MDDGREDTFFHMNEGLASRFISSHYVKISSTDPSEISSDSLSSCEISPCTVITIHCEIGVRETLEAVFGQTNPLVNLLQETAIKRNANTIQLSPVFHPSYQSSVGWYRVWKGKLFFWFVCDLKSL